MKFFQKTLENADYPLRKLDSQFFQIIFQKEFEIE